ncbi:MAG: ABC transporter permease [Deltaproteobacteria bacterium]|nr:ABC transporter permease [Deltaproteobacteria bacterium]
MALPLKYNLRSLFLRKMTTLATAGGIALVVLVTLLLLSLVTGLRQMLISTGRADKLVVLRKGASSDAMSFITREAYQAIRYLPGIAQTPEGEPLVSPESISQPLLPTKAGGQEIVLLRGVTPLGFQVHNDVRLVAGRMPNPSVNEAIVGLAAAQRYQGLEVGDAILFGNYKWMIVGTFSTDGTAYESEVWLDIGSLFNNDAKRGCSGIRLVVAPGTDQEALIRRIADDPRISLLAQSEAAYYEEQAVGARMLYLLTLVLALIMGIGAVFGAMNTMFAAVTHRTAEIGALRAIGFSRRSILVSFITESVCLSLLGYIGGVALGIGTVFAINRLMQGLAFQLPSFSTVVVSLRVSPTSLLIAFGLAVLMGLVGGFFPARRAAKLQVTEALRKG